MSRNLIWQPLTLHLGRQLIHYIRTQRMGSVLLSPHMGMKICKFTTATTKFALGGIRSDYISLIFRPLHKLFHARGPKFDLLQDACLRVYLCISFTRTASQHLESLLEHQLLCSNKSAEASRTRSNLCREPKITK
jgi:hypothetical protein